MALVAKQVFVTPSVNHVLMAEGKRRKMSQQELLASIISKAIESDLDELIGKALDGTS